MQKIQNFNLQTEGERSINKAHKIFVNESISTLNFFFNTNKVAEL